jgi:hypothetical protein
MDKPLTLEALRDACHADTIHIHPGRKAEFLSRVREDGREAIWALRIVVSPSLPADKVVLSLRGEVVEIINMGQEP